MLELPLRHIIQELDGKSRSGKDYSGEIGSSLPTCEQLPFDSDFQPLNLGSGPPDLPDSVIQDLSTDQKILYQLIKTVRTGEVQGNVLEQTIGPVVLSREGSITKNIYKILSMSEIIKKKVFDINSSPQFKLLVPFLL